MEGRRDGEVGEGETSEMEDDYEVVSGDWEGVRVAQMEDGGDILWFDASADEEGRDVAGEHGRRASVREGREEVET